MNNSSNLRCQEREAYFGQELACVHPDVVSMLFRLLHLQQFKANVDAWALETFRACQ